MSKRLAYVYILLAGIIGCAQNPYQLADKKVHLVESLPEGMSCKFQGSQNSYSRIVKTNVDAINKYKKDMIINMKVSALKVDSNFLIVNQVKDDKIICPEISVCSMYEGRSYKCE